MNVLTVRIPTYRKVVGDHEKSFTVYSLEVICGNQTTTVERRYSEFEALHKKLKRIITTPPFPPKKVLNMNTKVLETRRQILENYLQAVLESGVVPSSLSQFLRVSIQDDLYDHGSLDSLDRLDDSALTHQPVLAFRDETYLQDANKGALPDIVSSGVTQGLYGSGEDSL